MGTRPSLSKQRNNGNGQKIKDMVAPWCGASEEQALIPSAAGDAFSDKIKTVVTTHSGKSPNLLQMKAHSAGKIN